MSIIEDGQGTGKKVGVSDENRLKTTSISRKLGHHTNGYEQEAYHLLFQQTPTSINNCFLYVKNSSAISINIKGIWLRLDGISQSEIIDVKVKVAGTASGTIAVPVNCNASAINNAIGTFVCGNDVTGLSGGSAVERIYITSGNTSTFYNFEQNIIVPINQTFILCAEHGNNEIDGTLVFYYHNE